jgi:glycerol-3-phosphate dehydrogenase (NAD(P)+)
MICEAVRSPSFRAYYTDDLIGVELAGALKNVLAIGAGMSDGLGFGDNTKGALLARGLREMVRLGLSKGAQLETFFGIAGVGDLFATASSKLSRNYRVGYGLGKGQDIAEILAEIGQVAEGVNTAACVETLAKRSNLELPIMHMIHGVIMGQVSSRDAVVALMEREPKREALF